MVGVSTAALQLKAQAVKPGRSDPGRGVGALGEALWQEELRETALPPAPLGPE